MEYLEWKHIVMNDCSNSRQMLNVASFESNNPFTAGRYKTRLDEERRKIKKIMSIPDRKERIETIARNLPLFD